jgi:hypothetical protein
MRLYTRVSFLQMVVVLYRVQGRPANGDSGVQI